MNIIKYKNWFFAFSLALIIPGVIALTTFGLKLGIDFSGGTLWEVRISEGRTINNQDFQNFLNQEGAQVSSATNTAENSILVRMRTVDENQINQIRKKVNEQFGSVEDLRLETVGPTISKELTNKAVLAVFLATVAIVFYVTWAFRTVPAPTSSIAFGFCTIFALLHDILVVVAVFAVLGRFFNVEVDTLFITALLTVIGFSVHDSIVVFDRIRENLKKHKEQNFESVVNNSLLETMARSLNTSLTAIFVLMALLLFGGASIKIFVLALLVGIITGTYSSIFTAAPLLVVWHNFRRRQ